ncbi:Ni,Fe-hydrogenase I small subunit [Sagittula marina]|uniref:Ni,Fe-hydrogenase I small subunit n=1 Tax=Sagittula marina TaxID=943940 RepID=A0A7W6GSG3_9RHOB|nr:hypothetical protein [Sagittula marina]MBB3985940.1 Ni,Fe-hydrogenase I small subunit [Sagittula marina]
MPTQSGHGCFGCSEDGFWEHGAFYDRVTDQTQIAAEKSVDQIGLAAAVMAERRAFPDSVTLREG